jgi:Fe-S oxidoreductase
MQKIMNDKLSFSEGVADLVYRCVSCNTCMENCNENIEARVYIEALRKELVEHGEVPKTVKEVFKSEVQNGNVWGKPKNQRINWAEGLDIKLASETKSFEYLLFVGDSSAYVPRNQTTARLFVEILNKIGISFAILGNEERSSGNEVLRMGEEALFEVLAEENISNFKKYNVKKIVTLSPHGFHALKNEYPKLDPDLRIEVLHYTQLLYDLIKEGKLKFIKTVNKKVTYHDPCYIGRHNAIYDEPRKILNAIPGLELIEMDYMKNTAVCCGGGGGGIWIERGDGVMVDELRFSQAVRTKAEVLATACPLCAQQFEAVNENSKDKPLVVKDIIELVYEAL